MAKDILGHELQKDDWIFVKHLLPETMIGRIQAISDGGIAIPTGNPNQQAQMPGIIRVMVELNIAFDPTQPVNTFRVVPPDKPADPERVN